MTPPKGFAHLAAWLKWLATNHQLSDGLWLKIAKKGVKGLSYVEAVEGALCWGWIDSQAKSHDEQFYVQRFTPRRKQSPWSKINRVKVEVLIEAGKMAAPGLAEINRAKADGRWDAAYDGARTSEVPDDLARALKANKKAAAFFKTIDAANRFAVLYRVQTARKPETRASRIEKLVAMLGKHQKIHEP